MTTTATQPVPALPDELNGWRWQTHPTGDLQLRSTDGYATKWYTKPEKAIAEAQRRVLSTPKPKPEQVLATMMAASDMVPLQRIRTDGGTQARAQLDPATVAEYAETWQALSYQQNGLSVMPPIVVYYDGADYWLADGFHRVEAYKRFLQDGSPSASPRALRADIRQGTRRDAVLYACGANAGHGLRRSSADKRRAVETLLRDEEWRQWSDRKIAESCAVSDKTVAAVRHELSAEIPQIQTRTVERNGTTYQMTPATKPKISEVAPAPFWQALTPSHPTAHLWAPNGHGGYKSACGIIHSIAPNGSTEGGHCSSCVRATWKDEQPAPATPEPAGWFWAQRTETGMAHFWRSVNGVYWEARCGRSTQQRPEFRIIGAQCPACLAEIEVAERKKTAPPLSVAFRHSRDRHETDLDDALHARLAAVGYTWESAAITPDGRWHHVISARNTALLRNDQTRMRIERLAALVEAKPNQAEQPAFADRVAAIAAATPSIPDDIRQAAGKLELLIEVHSGGLLFHWPEESTDGMDPMALDWAREWLRDEAPGLALSRLDKSIPADLQKAGYFWKSADPLTLADTIGWTSQFLTVESALAFARDRLKPLSPPTESGVDWNAVARATYALGATSDAGVAWAKWLEVGRLLAMTEPATAAAHALRLIEALIPRLPKTELQEDLSRAIADLNECEEGTEWAHWTGVGWALLDCEAES